MGEMHLASRSRGAFVCSAARLRRLICSYTWSVIVTDGFYDCPRISVLVATLRVVLGPTRPPRREKAIWPACRSALLCSGVA